MSQLFFAFSCYWYLMFTAFALFSLISIGFWFGLKVASAVLMVPLLSTVGEYLCANKPIEKKKNFFFQTAGTYVPVVFFFFPL